MAGGDNSKKRQRDRDVHVKGLLPANLCSVTLLSSEQCSQFNRFHSQYIQKVKQNTQFQNTKRLAVMQR